MQISLGFEPRVFSGMSPSQPPRYTIAPFSFMLQIDAILTLLNFPHEDYRDLLIAFFFCLNNCFLFTKRVVNDFHLFRNKLGRFTNWYQRFSTVYHGFETVTSK